MHPNKSRRAKGINMFLHAQVSESRCLMGTRVRRDPIRKAPSDIEARRSLNEAESASGESATEFPGREEVGTLCVSI
jgi:hypothetical protein